MHDLVAPTDSSKAMHDGTTIDGVRLFRLAPIPDSRGSLTEIFRESWLEAPPFVQWNVVRSEAGTLRGVHVHLVHHDYLVCLSGEMFVGLRDERTDSRTWGRSTLLHIDAANGDPMAITIPPGVLHGMLMARETVKLYGVTSYWDLDDELGCHWADPALEIPWPFEPSQVSDRDRSAGGLRELGDLLRRTQLGTPRA